MSQALTSGVKGKPVSESRTRMTELVLPNDSNTHGNVLGGKVMHLIDLAGAISAMRHSRRPVVTVSVDSVRFLHPVRVGQLMLLEAVVTRVFNTSMEVHVEVKSENALTGEEKTTCTAFLTFVALNDDGKPTAVQPVVPETEKEQKIYESALARRRLRLEKLGSNE